jgi:predicted permease
MPIPARLTSLWRTLFRKDVLDRDLDDELRAALETLTARYTASGLSADAAARAALAELGGPGALLAVKENVRAARVGAWLEGMIVDVRYAWRGLRKARVFTAVTVATLALGIGANSAIFSVVRALLLEPLPYRDAGRLAFVWLGYGTSARGPLSGPDFRDLRQKTSSFSDLGAIWASGTVALTEGGELEQLRTALVTPNFFQVLGVGAALGRTFRAEDGAPGAGSTMLIGWDLFERRFGADPSIVGRQIVVDEQPATVIGVMPKTFRLLLPPDSSVPDRLQVWQPFWPDFENGPRGNLFLRVVGRMRPGVTIAQAQTDVEGAARRIAAEVGTYRPFTPVALQADDVREIRAPLLALFAGVSILLMIACVNVASLLVARASSRSRETRLRLALGASGPRLVRQATVEGLLLTSLGAAAGVFVGWVGLQILFALAPSSVARLDTPPVDATVVVFTFTISLVWGLLFSLAPAAELLRLRASPTTLLTNAGSRSVLTPLSHRMRATLVVVQIALSVVLLVGAGLLVRAFVEVQQVDPGFRSDRHFTFRVALQGSHYQTNESVVAASRALRDSLGRIPGVDGVGAISHLPFDDLPNWALLYTLATDRPSAPHRADTRAISPGLFETLGVQLVEGRFFRDDESPRDLVAIVDDALARRLWPAKSAVGQVLMVGQAVPERRARVVGVIRHLRLRSLEADLAPQLFVPYEIWQRTPMAYVVRTSADRPLPVEDIRAAVASVDPRLPVYDAIPLGSYVEVARSIRRFTMILAAAFAACALALTCIGVYGVLAYAVGMRRHEFGLRRALGAGTLQVVREVVREGLKFTAVGCAVGAAGALLVARFLQSQLYSVHPRDPVAYVVALGLVLAGAALACSIPTLRATAVRPMDVLGSE